MPMPPWQEQPANSDYKRKLAELQIPLPRWWPGRFNADVVGGDLGTGAVIVQLPVEGNPYLARVPAEGPLVGNTAATLTELNLTLTRYEWVEADWKYILFSRDYLGYQELAHIRLSMRTISLERSSRAVVFDPTDRELFNLQRQGFDWQLLQTGFVHRYRDRFSVVTAGGHLTDLDYLVHAFDAAVWNSISDMHDAFAKKLSFPSYYGRNLDAFNDVLSDVAAYDYGSDPDWAGTVLTIAGFDSLIELDRNTAMALLDIFARQARLAALYGHAMLCLVETTDNDLGSVGGIHVSSATVAEFPPDPPEPFDESTVVEVCLQIYSTDAEVDRYVADLRSAVAPVLDKIGRYVIRATLASERDGQSDERHRSSRRVRQPGQRLYDIAMGIRGRGDRNELSDSVFHAISAAEWRFDRMSEQQYDGPHLGRALAIYPGLANDANPAS